MRKLINALLPKINALLANARKDHSIPLYGFSSFSCRSSILVEFEFADVASPISLFSWIPNFKRPKYLQYSKRLFKLLKALSLIHGAI